ncbi:MAG TPA: hypothetical protein VMH23_04035 [Bacteroidota bacterium]|nr:hypothetical protein [Bacteroidota bacterium]
MRTRSWIRYAGAMLLMLVAQGCNDYTVKTIVSSDGSVDRIIEWKKDNGGGKEDYRLENLPFPIDSTWQLSWRHSDDKDSGLILVESKHFATYEALSAEYARLNTPEKLNIAVNVQKRFRWFYSYFDYDETYKAVKPFTLVPAKEFFTPDELHRLVADEINDTLKARIEEWENRNHFAFLFDRLKSAADSLHDPTLTSSILEAHKDALYRVLTSDSVYKGQTGNPGTDEERMATNALIGVQQIVHSPAVMKLRQALAEAIHQLMENFEARQSNEGKYTNTVMMPGVIVETNAKELSGSRVEWSFSDKQLSMLDLEMHVESRVVNTWAIVVSAVVVLGLLAVPVVLQVRNRAARLMP